MNRETRKLIAGIVGEIEEIKTRLSDLKFLIEARGEAEREKFENMPEAIQGGENGEAIDAAATALEYAAEVDLAGAFEEMIEQLNEAAE